ncbi:hypothetical protein Lal_00041441 [Lupinus albus]|nr:hypothetical protein Lal_00041441 [Lupinus albus]
MSMQVLKPSSVALFENDEIFETCLQGYFQDHIGCMSLELIALSNMAIVEEKNDGDLKTVLYQESPIISTYLVAVVVGLFDYVEDHTSNEVKVRVYCQIGKTDQGKFALHVIVKTLELFKDYFVTPYSLPKLDMIAIPDFAAGAMENYGLVTYWETVLLYDDQHSVATNKQRVATVVAHELTHLWFGNLVTMEWWTHLWLNEGFATWVSYLAIDSLFLEWKIWSQFLYEITAGLKLDGVVDSRPIEVEINHVGEIDEIFDVGYVVLYRTNEACINPDIISYNSLISSAARKCLLSKSLSLFDEMLQRVIHSDVWSYNILKLPSSIQIAFGY